MTTPAELITHFRTTSDIPAFLKVCSVGELRQLTCAYRSSHGLQESNGRTMYPNLLPDHQGTSSYRRSTRVLHPRSTRIKFQKQVKIQPKRPGNTAPNCPKLSTCGLRHRELSLISKLSSRSQPVSSADAAKQRCAAVGYNRGVRYALGLDYMPLTRHSM